MTVVLSKPTPKVAKAIPANCEHSRHSCPVFTLVCCLECAIVDLCHRDDKCPKANIVNHHAMSCMKRRPQL